MEARTLIEGRAAAQRLIAGDQTRRRGEAQVIAALCDLAETYRLDEADLLDSLAERRVRVGGEGTPSVSEHLRLEIAGLLGCTPAAATGRLADAINLKHRHPRLYEAVQLLEIDAARALKAAARCCDLHPALADPVTSRWLRRQQGLGWSAAFTLLDKLIIQADTALAAAKERKARADRGVWTWGLFDGVMNLTGRLDVLDAQLLESRLDQVAALLESRYPTLTHSQRRAKALTLDPRLAASLLDGAPQPGLPLEATCGCSAVSAGVACTAPELGPVPAEREAPSHQTEGPSGTPPAASPFVGSVTAVPQPRSHSELPDRPASPHSPPGTTAPATAPHSTCPAVLCPRPAKPPGAWVLETTERDRPRSHRPDAEPGGRAPARPRWADQAPAQPAAPSAAPVAEPSGAGNARPGSPYDGSTLPAPGPGRSAPSQDVAAPAPGASLHGRQPSPDQAKTPSPAAPVLHLNVHLQADSLGHLDGAARVERAGHITTALLAELLGELALDVRVQPVIDLPRIAPADRYEPTQRMRRAVQLAFPTEPFPFSTRSTTGSGSAGLPFSSRRTSGVDLDHTEPYRPGVKGQTRIGNLAPLSRGVHRAKTAGFWVLDQPSPGQLVWTSPLGYRYDVTEIGTRRQAAQAVDQTA